MVTKRSTPRARRNATANVSAKSIRQHIAGSFRDALEALDFSHEDAAQRLRLSVRTIGAYARGERPIVIEKIARCGQLFDRFVRCVYVGVRGRRW